eukprot:42194_1
MSHYHVDTAEGEGIDDNGLKQWLIDNDMDAVLHKFEQEGIKIEELIDLARTEDLATYINALGIKVSHSIRLCAKIKKILQSEQTQQNDNNYNTKIQQRVIVIGAQEQNAIHNLQKRQSEIQSVIEQVQYNSVSLQKHSNKCQQEIDARFTALILLLRNKQNTMVNELKHTEQIEKNKLKQQMNKLQNNKQQTQNSIDNCNKCIQQYSNDYKRAQNIQNIFSHALKISIPKTMSCDYEKMGLLNDEIRNSYSNVLCNAVCGQILPIVVNVKHLSGVYYARISFKDARPKTESRDLVSSLSKLHLKLEYQNDQKIEETKLNDNIYSHGNYSSHIFDVTKSKSLTFPCDNFTKTFKIDVIHLKPNQQHTFVLTAYEEWDVASKSTLSMLEQKFAYDENKKNTTVHRQRYDFKPISIDFRTKPDTSPDGPLIVINERKILMSKKQYIFSDVLIGYHAEITVEPWDSYKRSGGILLVTSLNSFVVVSSGKVDLTGKGYGSGEGPGAGGSGYMSNNQYMFDESSNQYMFDDYEDESKTKNNNYYYGGGDAGYGTPGNPGRYYENNTKHQGNNGGPTYGDSSLKKLYLGSGGGRTATDDPYAGQGGNGGGALMIKCVSFINEGEICADGQKHQEGYGGSGSGGSIFVSYYKMLRGGMLRVRGGRRDESGSGAGRVRIVSRK